MEDNMMKLSTFYIWIENNIFVVVVIIVLL